MEQEEFYIPEDQVTFPMKIVRFYFQYIGGYFPKFTSYLFWKLFTEPRSRKFGSLDLNFLKKSTTRRIVSVKFKKEFDLHVFGNGANTVILCHGWESKTVDFQRLISKLIQKGSYQVVSIDFPGHGTSPKSEAHLPLFMDVIDSTIEIYPDFYAIMGHSLGAASLSMSIGRNKSLTKRKVVFMGLHPVPSEFFLQYKSVTRISDKLFDTCLEYAERKIEGSLTEFDTSNYLVQYKEHEIALVHDTYDKIIRLSRVEKFSSKMPNIQLYHGNHGGHFRHYKSSESVRFILDFLKAK